MSMSKRTYLDWNATAPLRSEARAAMLAALDTAGNPSSVHAEGRAARRLIEQAREMVAALVGAKARDVVFTSGGTEANVLALTPMAGGGQPVARRCWYPRSSIPRCSQGVGSRPPRSSICR